MLTELLNNLIVRVVKEEQKLLDEAVRESAQFPEGNLRISESHGKPTYYHVLADGTDIYVKKNSSLVYSLAQKMYEEDLIKLLSKRINLMKKLIKPNIALDCVYNKLSENRKALVKPLTVTDEDYAKQWLSKKYVGKTFKKDVLFLLTDRGEKVRSKSELIIANALARNNVPYRYEFPYLIPNNIVVYPDFTVLNVRTREEFIFEHFGMMNAPDYLEQTLCKLEMYSNANFFCGRKLVATFESEGHPLNTEHLERLIRSHFC